MPGVAGGVSPRKQVNGQQPVINPDLLSASTTLQQSGSGGYARLVDALQALDQASNIIALAGNIGSINTQLATLASDVTLLGNQITALQASITSINGQIAGINTRLDQNSTAILNLTGEVAALQAQLDGVSFGAVGAAPTVLAGSLATTVSGTQYLLPLYSS